MIGELASIIQKHKRQQAIDEAIKREGSALSYARHVLSNYSHISGVCDEMIKYYVYCDMWWSCLPCTAPLAKIRAEFTKIMQEGF